MACNKIEMKERENHMRDAFSDCHPVVNFIFYIGALVMGMCFVHPVFLGISLVLSLAYYALVKKHFLPYLAGMACIFCLIALVNPLFNTTGEQVLFTWLGDRPYTLEALYYGLAVAGMFVIILTWFGTYNQVMTSDKFLYCFGRLAPSVSLILTMVLRLVPSFQKKAQQISGARKCIGKSVENGSTYEKAEHGMTVVSALTSWALEGGVIMADSMRSRGFGTGKRTSFSIYRMRRQDKILLGWMFVSACITIICAVQGGMNAVYTPQLIISGRENLYTILGMICYAGFLIIPTALHLMEEFRWHILRLKI